MKHKRITLFAGHYGSGKTNIAIAYALELAKTQKKVVLVDLDIVNPYFRAKDSQQQLNDAGIKFIGSPYANSNVDMPAIPPEIYSIFHDKSQLGVVDIGGDDRGACALGRYTPEILEENQYEMLLVVNQYRPLSRDVESVKELMGEMEKMSGIPFTAIVNNSNLGGETRAQDVLRSMDYAKSLSEATALPVKMTTVDGRLYHQLCDKIEPLMALNLQKRDFFSY